jgi:hypothetical protein
VTRAGNERYSIMLCSPACRHVVTLIKGTANGAQDPQVQS